MHLSKQAPPGAFHNCSYLNNAPPETCNYFSRGALIGSSMVIINLLLMSQWCTSHVFIFFIVFKIPVRPLCFLDTAGADAGFNLSSFLD